MKLDELAKDDEDLRAGVRTQLEFLGVSELASYVVTDDYGQVSASVATDGGLYVGTVARDGTRAGSVDGTLTPWSEVAGTRIAFVGFRNELNTVLVRIDAPPFEATTSRPGLARALADFATVCTRRQGRWALPDDGPTA